MTEPMPLAENPEYPIRIHWAADDVQSFENVIDIESALPGFDSEKPATRVLDNLGRPVLLQVGAHEVIRLELK